MCVLCFFIAHDGTGFVCARWEYNDIEDDDDERDTE